MKTLIAGCMALATLAFLPSTASADSYRNVGHCGQCNSPIRAYQVFVGYDSCHRPVYRWVKQAHHHPAPRPQYYHRSQPSVNLSFSFGSPYSSRNYRSYDRGYSNYHRGNDCRSSSRGSYYIRVR